MQLKIKILNFLQKTSFLQILFISLLTPIIAQEVVVVDGNGVAENTEIIEQQTELDTVINFKKFKAEGVSGVVGDFVILEFDIDKSYLEFEQNGVDISTIDRCQMIGKLMEDKLYVHQAIQVSILISDAEIEPEVDQLMAYMFAQVGSEE